MTLPLQQATGTEPPDVAVSVRLAHPVVALIEEEAGLAAGLLVTVPDPRPAYSEPVYRKMYSPESRSLAATYSTPPLWKTSTPQKLLPPTSMK